MKQSVPASFIAHVKYLLTNNAISTRELNRKLGKSISYITKLLSGQIKTIEYDTAFNIIKILAPNMSNIDQWLIEDIGIEPDAIIQKRFEDAEYEYERKIEEIKEAQDLVDNIGSILIDKMIGGEIQFETIELLKRIVEHILSNSLDKELKIIVDLSEKYPNKYRLLLLLINELNKTTDIDFGEWGDFIQVRDNENDIAVKFQKIIKEEEQK